jgi:hypothetical protein
MAWTQTDLDAIEKAIASGARRVRFQTHEVEYQSTGDMLRARNLIASELDEARRPGVMFTEYESGN